MKVLTCSTSFVGGRSLTTRLTMAMLGVYFAPKCLQPFYDPTMEAKDCVCVRPWLDIHVGKLSPAATKKA